jgi:hypothetical protein
LGCLIFSVMSIREALIAVVALVMMAPPVVAENANDLKYALECGAAKITPADDDSDPIYKTKIAVTDKVIYVVHYAASGETYIRNEQYRDLRLWAQEKTENWSGVSIKRPDRTMVGTIRMEKGRQWIEYVEKLFSGGKLETTIVSVCRPIPGSKGPWSGF